MAAALEVARSATRTGDVPVGAIVITDDGVVIGRGFNEREANNDPTAHAEIVAILAAQQCLQNYRLNECDLYVTIEPCLMCSGAIINSRIKRVIFGACEPKTGACLSQHQVFNNKKTNHHTEVIGPINQSYYSRLISNFFQSNQ